MRLWRRRVVEGPPFGPGVIARLYALLRERAERSSAAPLQALWGEAPALDAALLALLVTHRRALVCWGRRALRSGLGRVAVPQLARVLRAGFVRFLWKRNQFVLIHDAARASIGRVYRGSLRALVRVLSQAVTEAEIASAAQGVFQAHQRALAEEARRVLGPRPREVVSAEYAPALQVRALGLSWEELRGPLLDLGCGARAALVLALRARGLEAEGLDRDAPPEVAQVGDWLTSSFGAARWRMITSHLGFSLHFLHHHLGHSAEAARYAGAYLRILQALEVGGVFCYTPSLPFIEEVLPAARYRWVRLPPPVELETELLREGERRVGLRLGGASRVERVR